MTTRTHDVFAGSRFISSITELVRAQGITLETGSDFREWREILKGQPERNALAPKFDPERNDLNEATAFWIMGRDPQGEIVHTQAARTIDLGGHSLANYLQASFCEFTPAGYEIDKARSLYRSAPGSRAITGNVCYHGELWLKGGPGGYRGHGLTAALPRLALALAHMAWSPDYMFGLVHPMAACRGLAAREGYMHLEPGGILWQRKDRDEIYDEWMVWMSHSDLEYLLRFPPIQLYEQLEAKNKTGGKENAAFTSRVRAAA